MFISGGPLSAGDCANTPIEAEKSARPAAKAERSTIERRSILNPWINCLAKLAKHAWIRPAHGNNAISVVASERPRADGCCQANVSRCRGSSIFSSLERFPPAAVDLLCSTRARNAAINDTCVAQRKSAPDFDGISFRADIRGCCNAGDRNGVALI